MNRTVLISPDEATTEAIGAAVGATCAGGAVIALDGPLGAGKTRFARGLARGLGIDPRQVSSPTFVVCQEYDVPSADRGIRQLAHLDAYRLAGSEELDTIGWEDFVGHSDVVTVIEWAARLADVLPPQGLSVQIVPVGATTRELEFASSDVAWIERLRRTAPFVAAAT